MIENFATSVSSTGNVNMRIIKRYHREGIGGSESKWVYTIFPQLNNKFKPIDDTRLLPRDIATELSFMKQMVRVPAIPPEKLSTEQKEAPGRAIVKIFDMFEARKHKSLRLFQVETDPDGSLADFITFEGDIDIEDFKHQRLTGPFLTSKCG